MLRQMDMTVLAVWAAGVVVALRAVWGSGS